MDERFQSINPLEAAHERYKDVLVTGEDIDFFEAGYTHAQRYLAAMPTEQRPNDPLELVKQCRSAYPPNDQFTPRQAATIFGIMAVIQEQQGEQQ